MSTFDAAEFEAENVLVVAPKTWRYRVGRAFRIIAVVLASVLVLGSGAAFGYWKWLQHIAPTPVSINQPVPGQITRPPVIPGGGVNFLLLGSDSRDGLSRAELEELGTETVGGRRTDTIILLHLSADRTKTTLVSFPRDAYVDIPGYGKGRINTAFGKTRDIEAGANVLRATMEDLTGIHIDHYIEVDFRGFLDVVKAIGGVDVCLSTPAHDTFAGLNMTAGKHTVIGPQALAFVRARHFDPRADFGRIERQQKFLASMLHKATSSGVLLNPLRLNALLTSAMSAIRRDDKLGLSDIRALVNGLHGLDPTKVTFLTAPVSSERHFGVGPNPPSYVYLDTEAGALLWEAIRTDSPLPGAAPVPVDGETLTVAPSAIRLRVLNGTSVKGFARFAATSLRSVGFTRITGTASGDAETYTASVVRYGLGKEAAARTVVAALPGAQLLEDDTLSGTIDVVIGSDYTNAVPVTVTSAKPVRTGIAPAPFESRTAADDPCD